MRLQQLKAEAIKLSPQERLELVMTIVESLQNAPVIESERSAAINRMRGLLTTDRPEPTDEEVGAMLEDIVNRQPYQGKPKTIEQMNAAIDEEIRRKWQQ